LLSFEIVEKRVGRDDDIGRIGQAKVIHRLRIWRRLSSAFLIAASEVGPFNPWRERH